MIDKKQIAEYFPRIRYIKVTLIVIILGTTFLNIFVRIKLHFSTQAYTTAPTHFTILDYGFLLLLLLYPVSYLLSYRTKNFKYLIFRRRLVIIIIPILMTSSFFPTLSYINYGWHFPLHDYFLPAVVSGVSALHVSGMILSLIQYLGIAAILQLEYVSYLAIKKRSK